eukprot:2603483-Rhodomonas_salina.1
MLRREREEAHHLFLSLLPLFLQPCCCLRLLICPLPAWSAPHISQREREKEREREREREREGERGREGGREGERDCMLCQCRTPPSTYRGVRQFWTARTIRIGL